MLEYMQMENGYFRVSPGPAFRNAQQVWPPLPQQVLPTFSPLPQVPQPQWVSHPQQPEWYFIPGFDEAYFSKTRLLPLMRQLRTLQQNIFTATGVRIGITMAGSKLWLSTVNGFVTGIDQKKLAEAIFKTDADFFITVPHNIREDLIIAIKKGIANLFLELSCPPGDTKEKKDTIDGGWYFQLHAESTYFTVDFTVSTSSPFKTVGHNLTQCLLLDVDSVFKFYIPLFPKSYEGLTQCRGFIINPNVYSISNQGTIIPHLYDRSIPFNYQRFRAEEGALANIVKTGIRAISLDFGFEQSFLDFLSTLENTIVGTVIVRARDRSEKILPLTLLDTIFFRIIDFALMPEHQYVVRNLFFMKKNKPYYLIDSLKKMKYSIDINVSVTHSSGSFSHKLKGNLKVRDQFREYNRRENAEPSNNIQARGSDIATAMPVEINATSAPASAIDARAPEVVAATPPDEVREPEMVVAAPIIVGTEPEKVAAPVVNTTEPEVVAKVCAVDAIEKQATSEDTAALASDAPEPAAVSENRTSSTGNNIKRRKPKHRIQKNDLSNLETHTETVVASKAVTAEPLKNNSLENAVAVQSSAANTITHAVAPSLDLSFDKKLFFKIAEYLVVGLFSLILMRVVPSLILTYIDNRNTYLATRLLKNSVEILISLINPIVWALYNKKNHTAIKILSGILAVTTLFCEFLALMNYEKNYRSINDLPLSFFSAHIFLFIVNTLAVAYGGWIKPEIFKAPKKPAAARQAAAAQANRTQETRTQASPPPSSRSKATISDPR